MNTDDHEAPNANRQAGESDLGPEPDWLLDEQDAETRSLPEEPVALATPTASTRPVTESFDHQAVEMASTPVMVAPPRKRPWLWWAVPLATLVVTAIVAWFGSNQGMNGLTTWAALDAQDAPLLPARWSMLMWWIILPLMGVFLIYSALPAGRDITRIKRTGPLLTIGLAGAIVWIFAQHWRWEEVALASILVSLAAVVTSYLMIAMSPTITRAWQRVFTVLPLGAALGFALMLLTLSWQNLSSQPFGARGTSILLLFLLLIVAAVFAFFIRDGMPGVVFTIWFLGVAQQQWGQDALISLSAIVMLILTAALAAMGFILAVESHRPSLTTQITDRRGRVNFFRKTQNSPSKELP